MNSVSISQFFTPEIDKEIDELMNTSDDTADLERAFLETDNQMMETDNQMMEIDLEDVIQQFKCRHCQREFVTLEARDRYENNYHSYNRRWYCKHCNKEFRRDKYKLLHERICHRGRGQ